MDRKHTFDLVGVGELLIDFTPGGTSGQGNALLEQNPGGGVANLVVCAARLGSKSAFIGKVGDDFLGVFLKKTLDGYGVDTQGLLLSKEYPTTLAFVHLLKNGERDFTFYRDFGADTRLEAREVSADIIKQARALHFSSLTFTTSVAAEATREAIRIAKESGALITYDPNMRPLLWKSEDICKEGMREGIKYADVVKVSEEEMEWVTGRCDIQGAKALFDQGVSAVLLTKGDRGAMAYTPDFFLSHDAFPVKAIDATGAGDACFGAFIHCLLKKKTLAEALTYDELNDALSFANKVAAFCVTRRGGIPAMPTAEEVFV